MVLSPRCENIFMNISDKVPCFLVLVLLLYVKYILMSLKH